MSRTCSKHPFPLALASAIVSVVFAIDLFMVIWTRPYWLYLPSEDSIYSRVLNWKHLWVLLLIPFSLAVFALCILFIDLYGFVAVLVNEQVLRTFLSVLSVASLVTLSVAYASWRKREYLICPRCDFRPQNKGVLDVHFERTHGMPLKKAISELRVLLSKKQEKKAVGLTMSIGFFLVAVSWFVSYEVLLYEKFGKLYDMLLLILFDVILLWWGRHLLMRGLRPRIDFDHSKNKKAWPHGIREGSKLIFYPIILKVIVVVFLELPLVPILGESMTIIAAIILFQNSGLYLGVIVLYLRQRSKSVLVDPRRWEEIWSAKRSITWVSASYLAYFGMGALSLLAGHSLMEILRLSYMSADLIGIAWAFDYGNEVWKQILDAGSSRKKRRRSRR